MATPYLMRFHRIRYGQRSRNPPPVEVGEGVKVTKDKKVIKCSKSLDIKDYGRTIEQVVFSPKLQKYIINTNDDVKTALNYYGDIANEWYHNTEQFYDKLAEIPWKYAFVIYEDDKINKGLKMLKECEVSSDILMYGLFLGAIYEILVGGDKLGGVYRCVNLK